MQLICIFIYFSQTREKTFQWQKTNLYKKFRYRAKYIFIKKDNYWNDSYYKSYFPYQIHSIWFFILAYYFEHLNKNALKNINKSKVSDLIFFFENNRCRWFYDMIFFVGSMKINLRDKSWLIQLRSNYFQKSSYWTKKHLTKAIWLLCK